MPVARTIPGRSQLFTPATRPDRFAKAAEVGADALILDLEDSVAQVDKSRAREIAFDHLARFATTDRPLLALRLNALSTRAGLDDLVALLDADATPAFVILPKIEAAADLVLVDRLLTQADNDTALVALIESARALPELQAIVAATPRLAALMFGAADMAADLGADTGWAPLAGVRQRLVAAAAARALPVIDTPYFDVRDADGLRIEVAAAKSFGFTGKAAIHPAQVAIINDAFTPDAAAVAHARAVLAANAAGVGTVDGEMVDEAVARKARRVLAAADPAAD